MSYKIFLKLSHKNIAIGYFTSLDHLLVLANYPLEIRRHILENFTPSENGLYEHPEHAIKIECLNREAGFVKLVKTKKYFVPYI